MTRLVTLAALSFVLAAPAGLAQTADDDTPIQAGARALVFGVDLSSGLTGFGGGTLGIKWHASEARATRLGLTVNAGARVSDGDVTSSDAESTSDTDDVSASLFLGTEVVFLRYARPRTSIYLYRGLGPTGSLRVNYDDRDRRDGGQSRSSSSSFVEVGAGLTGVVGVEWPVASAVSLTAEYGASVVGTYARQSRNDSLEGDRSQDQTNSTFGLSVDARGVRGGVAVYF